MSSNLEDLADEFGVDLDIDLEPVEPDLEASDGSRLDMETKEATVVKPFKPGDGFVKDETHNFVLEDGSQFSVTVQKRPECPSCQHVLAEADEPNQLSGTCSVCGTETCHRCQSRCDACGTLLCPSCTTGHGLKDGTYCGDCLVDVDEDVEFDRGIEKRELRHSEEMDELEYELKEEKQEKKLQLQEAKQQRDQIRQDWKVVIQLLDTLQSSDDSDEDNDQDGFFGGEGLLDEGSTFSDSSGSVSGPDWLEETENEIDDQLKE
ncbi:hypothetical protein [Halorarum halobium]|uniref:hypothetical protein n=1 Tax=Halorarum halobium TaxID=3075121 RepID=UPI0028A7B3C8|nr:hypothetical protein [Halobaculum sp. XH14]